MDTYARENLVIWFIIVSGASIITTLIAVRTGHIETNVTYPMFLSIVAILLSCYAINSQGVRSHREEEIRRIEKSLENFYRPLQNLFIGYEQNPMDCYQEQKTKFLEISCYRHLAEPRALSYFEKCIQDDDSLKELFKQVMEDINMLQNKYKEKSNNKNFLS